MRTIMWAIFFFLFSLLFIIFPSKSYAQYGTYTISGYLFQDYDLSGSYDPGEPIIHHDIKAFGIGAYPATPVTYPTTGRSYVVGDSSTGIPAGNAYVSLTVPAGYVPFYPNNGPVPYHSVTVGPSCNRGSGTGHGATCSSGNINNLNFALRRVNIVSGVVFQDTNPPGSPGYGTYEPSPSGTDEPLQLKSVTITDTSGSTLSACSNIGNCSCTGATCTELTDASGNYVFGPLFKGTYSVAWSQASSTSPVSVTIQ